MRKYRQQILSIGLTAVLVMTLSAGCGRAGSESLETVDPSKYVTLGEYKGLSAEKQDTTVTDEDVEYSIQDTLESEGEEKEVTGRAAKMGDTVNIDYEGTKDGVAFDGGTGNYDLELGSGTFIPGFEEGVVGMNIGDEKDLPLTFPDDYQSDELAGADVIFHVTLNSISEMQVPELNDEFVKSLDNGTSTVAEYREYVRNELAEENETEAMENVKMDLLQGAVDNAECDMEKLPEWLVSQNTVQYKESTESFISQFGMTMDDYLEQMGSDLETFNQEAEEYGRDEAKSNLVVLSIAKAEGIEVTDQELEDSFAEYAEEYGTTVDEIKEEIPADELKMYLLQQEVMDFLYENADITEIKE